MGGAGWCCGCVGGGWLGLSAPYLSEVGEFTWQHMRVGWAPRGGQVHILGGIGHMKEFSHYTTILITTTTHPGPTTPTPHPPPPPPRSVEIWPSHGPSLCGELTSGVGRLLVLFMTPDGKCLCVRGGGGGGGVVVARQVWWVRSGSKGCPRGRGQVQLAQCATRFVFFPLPNSICSGRVLRACARRQLHV